MNIDQNINLSTEGVKLRFVEESDAKFIVDLRTDAKLGKNLSKTSSSIDDQVIWIEEYKKRESCQKEFYFIFEDSTQKPWGTVRLYNLTSESFTIGSWICLPDNKDKIAIKAWLLCVDFAFEKLNFDICLFDVRKKNVGVLYYAYLYHPTLISEDELNNFFRLDKATFYKYRGKVVKLLGLKM
jgi:hypothetical protein